MVMDGRIEESFRNLPRSICDTWKRKLLKLHAGAPGLEKPGIEEDVDALCFSRHVAACGIAVHPRTWIDAVLHSVNTVPW